MRHEPEAGAQPVQPAKIAYGAQQKPERQEPDAHEASEEHAAPAAMFVIAPWAVDVDVAVCVAVWVERIAALATGFEGDAVVLALADTVPEDETDTVPVLHAENDEEAVWDRVPVLHGENEGETDTLPEATFEFVVVSVTLLQAETLPEGVNEGDTLTLPETTFEADRVTVKEPEGVNVEDTLTLPEATFEAVGDTVRDEVTQPDAEKDADTELVAVGDERNDGEGLTVPEPHAVEEGDKVALPDVPMEAVGDTEPENVGVAELKREGDPEALEHEEGDEEETEVAEKGAGGRADAVAEGEDACDTGVFEALAPPSKEHEPAVAGVTPPADQQRHSVQPEVRMPEELQQQPPRHLFAAQSKSEAHDSPGE